LKLLYFDTTEVKEWLSLNRILLGVRLMMTYPFYLSWYDFASKFTHNKKILQILTFPSVFLGGSPHNTPALYAMLSSADFTGGIWYPKGGMNQIIAALENLLKKYKVTIIKNHDVTRINTKNGRAEYILLDNGKKIYADVFIGACDLYHLETSLLKKVDRSYDKQYWKKRTKAISAILLYIGINKKIKANHHTLFFNSDWDNHFDAIFNNKRPYNNPSFYVSIPSASDDSVAPRNATNMFVLVPTAANLKISKNYYKKYAASILRILEKKFGSFVDNLEVLKIYSPQDFNMDYNAYQGTALGIAHTLKQSIFLRPKTRSKKISNLYYVGQYTQPGIGVPMCLISAEIVSNQIRNEK
jgi:phytoene desaturase